MFNIFDDIGWYLEDQGLGTRGTDIFVAELPSDPNDCLAIFGQVGLETNHFIKDLYSPRFQVIVRSADYADGIQKSSDVRDTLHAIYSILMQDSFILKCHAEQEGGPIGRDEKGRFEFSINFSAESRGAVAEDSY
jgi:hypothetical protein